MTTAQPLARPRDVPAGGWPDFSSERFTERDRSMIALMTGEGLATIAEITAWWIIAWRFGLRD